MRVYSSSSSDQQRRRWHRRARAELTAEADCGDRWLQCTHCLQQRNKIHSVITGKGWKRGEQRRVSQRTAVVIGSSNRWVSEWGRELPAPKCSQKQKHSHFHLSLSLSVSVCCCFLLDSLSLATGCLLLHLSAAHCLPPAQVVQVVFSLSLYHILLFARSTGCDCCCYSKRSQSRAK